MNMMLQLAGYDREGKAVRITLEYMQLMVEEVRTGRKYAFNDEHYAPDEYDLIKETLEGAGFRF